MKARSVGDNKGFSTLELMIALAIMSIVLTGAVSANYAAQYWSITSQTSNEALYKAKTKLEDLRALVREDFYQATSSPLTRSVDPSDPNDTVCISGGLCYYVKTTITDLSSCSKYVQADVSWQVTGYPTSSTALFTNLTNSNEAIALGGDCVLSQPAGNWSGAAPQSVGSLTFTPGKFLTGIDAFHREIYVTAATNPYLLVYSVPTAVGKNPVLAGSSTGGGMRLNDIDVEEDLSTGRTYAFAAENATTTQLAVFDVTDPASPTLVTERQLLGVDPYGSFPQGWKVFVYGNRLYMTTRESSGNEFHIFNIAVPAQPTEIGSGFQLTRTVNDMIVRDQKVNGIVHRFVFLAADADSKELGVFDVTNDVVSGVASVDLPGTQDGLSLFLLGHQLYFGRAQNSAGPELYVFDVSDPATLTTAAPHIIGRGEVGADVSSLRASGTYAFIGTGAGQMQVWNSDYTIWNSAVLNAGRFQSYNFAHIAPTGIDLDQNWVFAISQFATSDALQILYTP